MNRLWKKTKNPAQGRRGYTLPELLVVLFIIGILAGLTTLIISWAVQATDDLVDRANAAQVPQMRRQALADKGKLAGLIRDRFIVVLQNNENPRAAIARMQPTIPLQVTHVYNSSIKGFAAVIPPASVAAVGNFACVKYLTKDQILTVQGQTLGTGIRRIGCLGDSIMFGAHTTSIGPITRDIGYGVPKKDSTQVVVAVMDTGIDKTHPDLHVVFSRSFGPFNDLDLFGHGTHVSGIVGAINNDIGVVGVCPGCRLWNLKVLDAKGSGTLADIIAGLDFVAANANNIQVVNMSLGAAGVVPPLNDAVTACWNLGVVMVIAAGNSAIDARGFSPASAAGAITVGALADSDGKPGGLGPKLVINGDPDDTMASFSNFGPRVDILGPGVDILSTYPVALGSYKKDTGTSMAAPHVAGLCALMLSPVSQAGVVRNIQVPGAPALTGHAFTPDQVKQMLLQTVGTPRPKYTVVPGLFDSRLYPIMNARPF